MPSDRQPKSDAHIAYGQRLRDAREAAKLSRAGLAHRIRHSEKTIGRYEAGISFPDESTVTEWESACRLLPGTLLDEQHEALVAFAGRRERPAQEPAPAVPEPSPEGAPSPSQAADRADRPRPWERGRRYLGALGIFAVCVGLGGGAVTIALPQNEASSSSREAERFTEGLRTLSGRLDRVRLDARRRLAIAGAKRQAKAAAQLSGAYAEAVRANRELDPPARAGSVHAQLDGALVRAGEAYRSLADALRGRGAFATARTSVRRAEENLEMVLAVLGSAELSG